MDERESEIGQASTPVDWAARRVERRMERRDQHGPWRLLNWFRRQSTGRRWAIALPVGLISMLVLAVTIDVVSSAGRVHPGVSVSGIGVGGKSRTAAVETLEAELTRRMSAPVTLQFEEQTWSVEASEVAAAPDAEAMASAAMAVGREGTLAERIEDRAKAWLGVVDLPPVVSSDPLMVEAVVATINDEVGRDPVDASVAIDGTEATLKKAQVGVAVRAEALVADLLRAMGSEDRQVSVGVEFVPVEITDEEAEVARQTAERMMSGAVVVKYDKRSWKFSARQIADWIDFRMVESEPETRSTMAASSATETDVGSAETSRPAEPEIVLEAFISADEASKTITAEVGEAGRPAKDARFEVGGGKVTIIPSEDGVGPDIEALAKDLTLTLGREGKREVELRTQRVKPEITTADAEGMGIKERISTYTTTYDPSNKPRVNNIHTLSSALDHTLIPPGGVFSFNETIGPRTAEKGYQEAPAIVNGKLVPQLGGGICQVGTTIFNTVYESGLPVVERRNHSFYISHYPKGRDATVSWGGPDFKFKNDTEDWVLVATGYSNSSLTISLYGTDPGYTVRSEVGAWSNVKAHPVEEIEDDTMPEGSRVVEDGGVDGRTIVVTRVVTKGGQEIRRDTFTSVYKPKTEVVRIGTKKKSVEATETAGR